MPYFNLCLMEIGTFSISSQRDQLLDPDPQEKETAQLRSATKHSWLLTNQVITVEQAGLFKTSKNKPKKAIFIEVMKKAAKYSHMMVKEWVFSSVQNEKGPQTGQYSFLTNA